ncbi:hypothetical protein GCM10008941_21670 [Rhizomicrobium palustre]
MSAQIRIVIAEDQTLVLGAIAALLGLEDDLHVVGRACNGEDTLTMVRALRPDILLTDVEMPGLSCIELAHAIEAEKLPVRVIVVTTYARPGYLTRARAAKVSGYRRRQGRHARHTFKHSEAGGGGAQHVESAAVEPRSIPAITAHADNDNSWAERCQFRRRQTEFRHLASAIAVHKHICGLRESFAGSVLLRVIEIEKGRACADIGIVIDPRMLKIVGTIDTKHVGALFGESATDDRPGNGMRQTQHADTLKRALRRGERHKRAFADFSDNDHRLVREISPLRMR